MSGSQVRRIQSLIRQNQRAESAGPSVAAAAGTSTNIYYVKPKRKVNRKVLKVDRSFKQAFHKLQPTKEIRFDVTDLVMDTATSVATRTKHAILDNIAQGTQLNQRLGSNIHMSYVHLKGTIQSNSTAKAKAMRIMIFKEVNNQGVNTTTYANLWKGTGTITYAPLGLQSDTQWPLNRELVHPIYDRTFQVRPEYNGITRINIKKRINRIVKYQPNNSGATSPYHGRIFLLCCLADCDNSTSATTVILTLGVRVFFKDYFKAR